MDYSKHPESSKLRDCKASAHIPEWRKLEEQAQPKPARRAVPGPQAEGKRPQKAGKEEAQGSRHTRRHQAGSSGPFH